MTTRPPERKPQDLRVPLTVGIGALEGMIAGWILYDILIWIDFAGLGGLFDRVDVGRLMFWLGAAFFGITFGMLGIAWRVMVLLPGDDD
ncbi:MAG: hypothetical protein AAF409_08065 [Pseudomonadota bacterium]